VGGVQVDVKRAFLILFVVASTAPLWVLSPAGADCGAPELSVNPAQVAVGDEITISGEYWNDVCNDTSVGVGCAEVSTEKDQPSQDVELFLVNRDTREQYELGVVDADENFEFELTATADVPAGWYVIKDAGGQSYVSIASRFRVIEG
jgi:hypothetical protein